MLSPECQAGVLLAEGQPWQPCLLAAGVSSRAITRVTAGLATPLCHLMSGGSQD